MPLRYYSDRFILTPGPTEIPWRIYRALLRRGTNPDLDPGFFSLYEGVRNGLGRLLNALRSNVYIMSGEAMLGLEAAVANTIKKGDKVLVVSNGVYGEAFSDLVKAYGGKPIRVGEDWRRSLRVEELKEALEKHSDVAAVTLVHCDTPSAILNPLRDIGRVVSKMGALLIVDAVSTVGGVEIDVDGWGIDILVGGSQKALNMPPGLTIITVSEKAWRRIEEVGYEGFYMNLMVWREELDEKGVFPYTMPEHLIYALNESLDILMEEGLENVYRRHLVAREASWNAVKALGLEAFPMSIEDSSPTVTAIRVPENVDGERLVMHIWRKYGVMVAGSWGRLKGKVVRVGHMGVTASRIHLILAYTALAKGLRDLGIRVDEGAVIEAIEAYYP